MNSLPLNPLSLLLSLGLTITKLPSVSHARRPEMKSTKTVTKASQPTRRTANGNLACPDAGRHLGPVGWFARNPFYNYHINYQTQKIHSSLTIQRRGLNKHTLFNNPFRGNSTLSTQQYNDTVYSVKFFCSRCLVKGWGLKHLSVDLVARRHLRLLPIHASKSTMESSA